MNGQRKAGAAFAALLVIGIIVVVVLMATGVIKFGDVDTTTTTTTPSETTTTSSTTTSRTTTSSTTTSSTPSETTTTSTLPSTSTDAGDSTSSPLLTVRQRLEATCPRDPAAGNKISAGNLAPYDDYLFSACTAANMCDTTTPDPISDRIINMKKPEEHCGSWNLDRDPTKASYTYTWNNPIENRWVRWKTVRERLQETCPVDPKADGKISVGNLAPYDDYLFSACTAANTCDGYNADPVSDRIINMKKPNEFCGAWNLHQIDDKPRYTYTPGNPAGNKWVESVRTVRERLQLTCPVDPNADGKISVGNGASYDNYLFSACTAANTCDTTTPDVISNRIINMKKPEEKCGSWNLTYKWDNPVANRWVPM